MELNGELEAICKSYRFLEAWNKRLGIMEVAVRIRLFLRGSKGPIKSIQKEFVEHLLHLRL